MNNALLQEKEKCNNKVPNLKTLVLAATVGSLVATSPTANAKRCRTNSYNFIQTGQVHNPKTQYSMDTEGTISNGDVQILDPLGNNIYNTYTDKNGQIIIDKNSLLINLQENGYEINTVEELNSFETPLSINVTGGIIKDANLDGCTDRRKRQVKLKGEYSAIGELADLNNGTIGIVSSLVERIVNGKDNVNMNDYLFEYSNSISDQAELQEVTERIQDSINLAVGSIFRLKDTNDDGVKDNLDILHNPEKQVKTRRILVRNKYQKSVRRGYEKSRTKKENRMKKNMNLVDTNFYYDGQDYIVNLDSITSGMKVEYSENRKFKNSININFDEELVLQEGNKIYFREKLKTSKRRIRVHTIEVKNGELLRNGTIIGYPEIDETKIIEELEIIQEVKKETKILNSKNNIGNNSHFIP